jgi:hypothetical protein
MRGMKGIKNYGNRGLGIDSEERVTCRNLRVNFGT